MPAATFHQIWGSAHGPLTRLAPQSRILCGLFVFSACLTAPVDRLSGVVAVSLFLMVWLGVTAPPPKLLRGTFLLGLVLFLPYFLLVPLIRYTGDAPVEASGTSALTVWLKATRPPWVVFFRGLTAMSASVATASTLSMGALRQGLMKLPVPKVLAAVIVQIVQQTAALWAESRRIAAAVAVRGGTSGFRTAVRVLTSLPKVWLPRVVHRAESVGDAMELRGYRSRHLAEMGTVPSHPRDHLAVTASALTLVAFVSLRLWGSPLGDLVLPGGSG